MARALVLLDNKFTSLCQLVASQSRKWKRKWRACYGYGYEHDPVIQLNNEEIDESYYYFGEVDPNTCSGEVSSIWKKNIIMGGKCQLPEFSGVIIYDTAGNLVNPKTPRPLALPWKE